jgi:tetratricopeptide (TPR) repeat protein
MHDQSLMVDDKLFVGRVEEQKQFRAALAELLNPPPTEDLPYVCLLHGDGGTGKTTLAGRFRDIVQSELPYAGEFQVLWIDWEDERKKFPGLQVGRQQISPETVFRGIHAAGIRKKWGRQFVAYRKAVNKREEAAKKVAEAITSDNDWDELAILRSLGVDALAKIVRFKLPMIGDAGEDVVQTFLDFGIKVGAEQAFKLRTAIETQLRAHLKSDHFDFFLNPFEQLALALARGLNRAAKGKRLLVVLDSYEIVDHVDIWMRTVIHAAGPRVMWVISGRNDLVQSRQFGLDYFKGYADDTPRRLLAYKMLPLAVEDIRTYFMASAPKRDLAQAELETISRVTRGIPLAVKVAADIWNSGATLQELAGDAGDIGASGQLVQRMTDRYMQHVVAEADKQALYALALAEGDVELLRAMLRPDDGAPFDLEEVLRRLERDYTSVHANSTRLHDDPAVFFREFLQADVRRTSQRVQNLNRRAVEALQVRLANLESDLPLAEDRCQDDSWTKATLAMANYLFWVNETEAWHWIIPRFVEAMAYNRDLQDGLVKVAGEWIGLGESTERLHGILSRDRGDADALLKVLQRLDERGWLDGDDAEERRSILRIHQGNLLLRRRDYAAALKKYDGASDGLPPEGRQLKEQLAGAYELLAHRMLWPTGRHQAAHSAPVELILDRVLEWFPERHYAWYLLGVNFGAAGQYDEAIEALRKAVELNPQNAAALNALGNVYSALNRYDEAQSAYEQAADLDPSSAKSFDGLGSVYTAIGSPEQAITAYEEAIARDADHSAAYIGLGWLYLGMERNEEALAAFEEGARLAPEQAAVHNGLGDAHIALGQVDQAAAAYRRAIELDPHFAPARSGLGKVCLVYGRPDAACTAFEQAIEIDPNFGAAHAGLGNVYADTGRPEKAIQAYERAVRLGFEDAATFDKLARVYRARGLYPEALDAHQKAVNLDPDFALSYENLGDVYMALDRFEEAVDAYRRSAAAREGEAGPLTGMGDALYALKRRRSLMKRLPPIGAPAN